MPQLREAVTKMPKPNTPEEKMKNGAFEKEKPYFPTGSMRAAGNWSVQKGKNEKDTEVMIQDKRFAST